MLLVVGVLRICLLLSWRHIVRIWVIIGLHHWLFQLLCRELFELLDFRKDREVLSSLRNVGLFELIQLLLNELVIDWDICRACWHVHTAHGRAIDGWGIVCDARVVGVIRLLTSQVLLDIVRRFHPHSLHIVQIHFHFLNSHGVGLQIVLDIGRDLRVANSGLSSSSRAIALVLRTAAENVVGSPYARLVLANRGEISTLNFVEGVHDLQLLIF